MRKLFFILAILPFAFVGCSSDDDNEETNEVFFAINVKNSINKSLISSEKYDGNLYDVYVVGTAEAEFVPIGDILNGQSKSVNISEHKFKHKKYCVLFKVGKDRASALAGNIHIIITPQTGLPFVYNIGSDNISNVVITEKTRMNFFTFTNIEELKSIWDSAIAQVGNNGSAQ